jgi:hypothetical protein
MTMQALLPKGIRSATAAPGYEDIRDDEIYSAGVLQYGGQSEMSLFTVPKGQAIPYLRGSAITATTNGWQSLYSDLTTNLAKAGELGSGIGDVAVRAVFATIEQASYNSSTGVYTSYGATPWDVQDILSKTYLKLKVGQKTYIQGQTFRFPSGGGAYGSISTTQTGVSMGVVGNGVPGRGRPLKMPIVIERSDTLEAIVGVAPNSSLVLSTASGTGQPTLLWINLASNVGGDVR